jgi:HlyD family secretion protein
MPAIRLSGPVRLAAAGLLAAAIAGGYFWFDRKTPATGELKTAKVELGPLTAVATASGTLNPVVSVQVGSQVSGQLREVLVDFNSEVRRGQLIARIDPETFEYRVRQSEADLDAARAAVLVQEATVQARRTDIGRAEVNLAEAKRDLARKEELVARKFISPSERDKAEALAKAQEEDVKTLRAQLAVAEAQVQNAMATVKQRQAALAQAKVDLDRTQIRAPIDGIVIKRTIEPGQTVAASLQAPELFVIAKNLDDMQVDTSIDESEIGKIRPGQAATFTVDAFPGRTFNGSVLQVRKAAQNVSNVITYTAVVSARNDDLSLLPGMTANVRIVTDRRESVLKVPNAALRYKPAGFDDAGKGEKADGKGGAQAAAPSGDRMKANRERLERELALDADQKAKLEAAYASVRDKFMALRELPEAERARASERVRAELRDRIAAFLNKAQLEKYAAINAEQAGRAGAGRGRVFVLDAQKQPQPVNVRTGLSDGSYTEVLVTGTEPAGAGTPALKEGDTVIIGAAAPAAASRPSGGPRGF